MKKLFSVIVALITVHFTWCYLEDNHEEVVRLSMSSNFPLYVRDTTDGNKVYEVSFSDDQMALIMRGMNEVDTKIDYANHLSWHVCEEYLDLPTRRVKYVLEDALNKISIDPATFDPYMYGTSFHVLGDFYAHVTYAESNYDDILVNWGEEILRESDFSHPEILPKRDDVVCPTGQPGTVTNQEVWSSAFTNLAYRLQFVLEFKAKLVPYIGAGTFAFFFETFKQSFCWVPEDKCGHGRDVTLNLPVVGLQHIVCPGIHKDMNGTNFYLEAFDATVRASKAYVETFIDGVMPVLPTTTFDGHNVYDITDANDIADLRVLFKKFNEFKNVEFFIEINERSYIDDQVRQDMFDKVIELAQHYSDNYKAFKLTFKFVRSTNVLTLNQDSFSVTDLTDFLQNENVTAVTTLTGCYQDVCSNLTPAGYLFYGCILPTDVVMINCFDNNILEEAVSLSFSDIKKSDIYYIHAADCGEYYIPTSQEKADYLSAVSTRDVDVYFYEITSTLFMDPEMCQCQVDCNTYQSELTAIAVDGTVTVTDGVTTSGSSIETSILSLASTSDNTIAHGDISSDVINDVVIFESMIYRSFMVDSSVKEIHIDISMDVNVDSTIDILGPIAFSDSDSVVNGNILSYVVTEVNVELGTWTISISHSLNCTTTVLVSYELHEGKTLGLTAATISEIYLVTELVETSPFLDLGQGPRWFNPVMWLYMENGQFNSLDMVGASIQYLGMDGTIIKDYTSAVALQVELDPFIRNVAKFTVTQKIDFLDDFRMNLMVPGMNVQRLDSKVYTPTTHELTFQTYSRNIFKNSINNFHVSIYNVGAEDDFTLTTTYTTTPGLTATVEWNNTPQTVSTGGVYFYDVIVKIGDSPIRSDSANEVDMVFVVENSAGRKYQLSIGLDVEDMFLNETNVNFIHLCDYALDPFTDHTYLKDNLSQTIDEFRDLNCEILTCDGQYHTSQKVCNGHGDCEEDGQCTCDDENYQSTVDNPFCGSWHCNDILHTDDNVCNAHGVCTRFDQCKCAQGWKGKDCSEQVPGFEEYLTYGLIIGGGVAAIIFVVIIILVLIAILSVVVLRIRKGSKPVKEEIELEKTEKKDSSSDSDDKKM